MKHTIITTEQAGWIYSALELYFEQGALTESELAQVPSLGVQFYHVEEAGESTSDFTGAQS